MELYRFEGRSAVPRETATMQRPAPASDAPLAESAEPASSASKVAHSESTSTSTATELEELRQRFDALERVHVQTVQKLEAMEKHRAQLAQKPVAMAHIGQFLIMLNIAVFHLQSNVWNLLYKQYDNRAAKADANAPYPRTRALAISMLFVGMMCNAVAVMCVVHFVAGRTDLFSLGVSYIAWFSFVALEQITKEVLSLRAGAGKWKHARSRFRAVLFSFFGITDVWRLEQGDIANALYFLVGLIPAIVAGFLVRWMAHPRYGPECNARWTNATDGVAFCAPYGVCCKIEDERTQYFTFTAYLSGNVIAAFAVVKFGAMCLLAFDQNFGKDGDPSTRTTSSRRNSDVHNGGITNGSSQRVDKGQVLKRCEIAAAMTAVYGVQEDA